jgi:hypothetical protein
MGRIIRGTHHSVDRPSKNFRSGTHRHDIVWGIRHKCKYQWEKELDFSQLGTFTLLRLLSRQQDSLKTRTIIEKVLI